MTRKSNRPEELWIHASYQQVADLRDWIQSRMKERHADSISAWLLSLGTDEPAEPHKRQLAFFRQILDEYGPPRPIITEASGGTGEAGDGPTAPEPPSDVAAGAEPSTGPLPSEAADRPDPASAQPAGRFHRA